MEKEIVELLTKVQNKEMNISDAKEQIFDLFVISRRSILCGGDNLSEYGEGHKEDCEIIKGVLIEKGFINAGLNDAVHLWSEYSDSYCAGWLGLPEEKEEIYNCIEQYITKTHNFVK